MNSKTKGYGINDRLQALKTLTEKCVEYNKLLTLIFLEFKKALKFVECQWY